MINRASTFKQDPVGLQFSKEKVNKRIEIPGVALLWSKKDPEQGIVRKYLDI